MGATPDFRRPEIDNPNDADLDWIRDNYHNLLMLAANACAVAPNWGEFQAPDAVMLPGWQTLADISANNNYAEPDAMVLTKGTQVITFNYTWTSNLLTRLEMCYHDGVTGETCFDPLYLFYDDAGNFIGTVGPTSLSLFGGSLAVNHGDSSWNDTDNVLYDETTSPNPIAQYTWDTDYTSNSDYIEVYDPQLETAVPADATIVTVTLQIRAWLSGAESPITASPIYLNGLQIFYGDTDPGTGTTFNTQGPVTPIPTTFEFSGDLAYWGLTNAQMQALFGNGAETGFVLVEGYCNDTSILTGQVTLNIDWIKVQATYK